MNVTTFLTNKKDEVALTTTSANTIANMAKEYYQSKEKYLAGMCFYSTDIKLIGSDDSTRIGEGFTNEQLLEIPTILNSIDKCKSLIAWLREGIKAKETVKAAINNATFESWAILEHIDVPVRPMEPTLMTEDEYYSTLDIKTFNRYFQLEAIAATIGKYIHPKQGSGWEDDKAPLAYARTDLMKKMVSPFMREGSGRDTTIYTYTPTVDKENVEKVFFELQKQHREAQSQLNSIKHNCEEALTKDAIQKQAEYTQALEEYNGKMAVLQSQFKEWRNKQYEDWSSLKIVVPHSLMSIYNLINSLGKDKEA